MPNATFDGDYQVCTWGSLEDDRSDSLSAVHTPISIIEDGTKYEEALVESAEPHQENQDFG